MVIFHSYVKSPEGNSGVKYSHTHIIDCLDFQQNYGDPIIQWSKHEIHARNIERTIAEFVWSKHGNNSSTYSGLYPKTPEIYGMNIGKSWKNLPFGSPDTSSSVVDSGRHLHL